MTSTVSIPNRCSDIPLVRIAPLQSLPSGSPVSASEADEPRHLRRVVGCEGTSRFLPIDCGGSASKPAPAAVS